MKVAAFDRPRRLGVRLSDGIEADIASESHDGDATRVSVTCTGLEEFGEVKEATSMVDGFSIVLCDLKTLLETGRPAHLVRDMAELITRARATSCGT